jgi:hypothetical protein
MLTWTVRINTYFWSPHTLKLKYSASLQAYHLVATYIHNLSANYVIKLIIKHQADNRNIRRFLHVDDALKEQTYGIEIRSFWAFQSFEIQYPAFKGAVSLNIKKKSLECEQICSLRTDGRTDRQTDRQTHRQTDRQTDMTKLISLFAILQTRLTMCQTLEPCRCDLIGEEEGIWYSALKLI